MMKNRMKLWVCTILIGLTAGTVGAQTKATQVLLVGGGSSHDFERWYRQEDVKTTEEGGAFSVRYTDRTDSIVHYLKNTDVLVLSNNQPIDEAGQKAIMMFVNRGKGIVLLHAAVWYNWADWPIYNADLVGGGSRSHEKFQEFKNYVVNPTHPITQGVPSRFDFKDELYRHEFDPAAKGAEVLVIGQSIETDAVYPVVYTVKHPKAKVVGITLGHDEHSHEHEGYKKLLQNAVKWVLK